jgi:hypothetical protein
VGVVIPDDFPQEPYDATHARVTGGSRAAEAMFHYGGAWNAVAYRFVACARSDEKFTGSVWLTGTARGHAERFDQEDALFNFFVQGLAAIESFFYGLYWLGSMTDTATFPILSGNGLRDIKLEETIRKYIQKLGDGPLVSSFGRLRSRDASGNWKNTDVYEEWKVVRNILAHRAAYGRVVNASSVGPVDDVWKVENIPLNDRLTGTRRRWLASTLGELMQGAHDFASSNL